MIKCSDNCIPCCDFCIYAEHEELKLDNGTYVDKGSPTNCKLHPDKVHNILCELCGYCDDFHCF